MSYGDVLKNKARLVAKGYRQEEGIDFEDSLHRLHVLRLFESSSPMPPEPLSESLWYLKDTAMATNRPMRCGPCRLSRHSKKYFKECVRYHGDKLVSLSSKKTKEYSISTTKAGYMPMLDVVLRYYR
ncbi:hypothetical protein Tco_0509427 [Tanacetum coccineum]|uniref:Retrovirus-related Pol polyprotein from transposon TNT 1-94 n=1 Tax=Tanacetum coccineum TaxID=301880 RepID=A0ABQ5BHI9_9ASTR